MQSRIAFIECGGNSAALNAPQAQRLGMAAIHGLLGCSEWTGVRLSTLLDEAGVEPSARWLIAEGADSAALSRSIPLAKAMDDALVCLYQNGERVRPSNGYPVRLLLPGFEGIMNVKWLRRIKLVNEPAMTKDETSKYTILLKDERAARRREWTQMGYLFGQKRRKVGRLQRQAARCLLVTPEADSVELGTWCWPRVVLIEKRPLTECERSSMNRAARSVGARRVRRLGRNNWIWRLPDDVAARWR